MSIFCLFIYFMIYFKLIYIHAYVKLNLFSPTIYDFDYFAIFFQ